MNKFRISAIEILKQENKPLHSKEITRLALERGILETEGATPEASMTAQIIIDMRNRGEKSDFIKVSPSTYALNPKREDQKIDVRVAEKEEAEEEKIKIESGYTGKGGEHLVCSELLFRGFNASIMSVDVGMDIIATKDYRLFSIQVKTSNLNKYNVYNFDVRKVSFERHDSGGIYYVFVLRNEKKSDFLIFPYHEMAKQVENGGIIEIMKGSKYRVRVMVRGDKIYLGNQENEVGYYLNRWDIIK